MASLTLTPGPPTETHCTFVADRILHDGDPVRFSCDDDPRGSRLVAALLAVPGVHAVTIAERSFTIEKRSEVDWDRIEEPLKYAVTAALEESEAVSPAPGWSGSHDDDTLFEVVGDLFEREINPSVAQHGGHVELIDVQDATVILRMQGGCQGCGMASVTLRQGIEGSLRRVLPGLQGIVDITDHEAGTNPYFEAEKR
jgi:NFU1 iron-sulfur cluster scaffold homolog, mitochondrial